MPSFETSGIPRRIAAAAIQRSAVCAFCPSAMARGIAVSAQLGVDRDELGAAVDDLDPLDLRFQLEHPRMTPPATDRAVPQLGRRLKRDECWPSGDQWGGALRKARARDEFRAEDVGVDDDRAARSAGAHDSTASRKATPSSSVRSSITISSWGGSGRARRSSSSTGSSRSRCSLLSDA
jgi:hypothetical protein